MSSDFHLTVYLTVYLLNKDREDTFLNHVDTRYVFEPYNTLTFVFLMTSCMIDRWKGGGLITHCWCSLPAPDDIAQCTCRRNKQIECVQTERVHNKMNLSMKFKPLTAGADATVYILGMLCLVFEYLQYCMHTKHRNQLFCTVLYCTMSILVYCTRI